MMIFKARVKSIEVDDNSYYVTFDYCDRIKNSKGEFGVAYEEDNATLILKSLAQEDRFIVADERIFSFIFQHTREVLEVSYEDKSIKKVKLSYE
jgi:hypothetical protein